MRKISFFATLALAALPTAASAQSAETIIDRAASAYSRLASMRAEFQQTLTNPLTGTTQTTSGEIVRRLPNLLAITFNNGDRVTADGSTLWVYLPSSVPDQVIRMPYNNGNSGSVDPAEQFLKSPRARYSVTSAGTATIGGHKTHAVTLISKGENTAFTRGQVWIDDADYSVRQFEVVSASGLTRKVVITSFTANPKVDRSAFRFSVPKGAKVVDQSALSGVAY